MDQQPIRILLWEREEGTFNKFCSQNHSCIVLVQFTIESDQQMAKELDFFFLDFFFFFQDSNRVHFFDLFWSISDQHLHVVEIKSFRRLQRMTEKQPSCCWNKKVLGDFKKWPKNNELFVRHWKQMVVMHNFFPKICKIVRHLAERKSWNSTFVRLLCSEAWCV